MTQKPSQETGRRFRETSRGLLSSMSERRWDRQSISPLKGDDFISPKTLTLRRPNKAMLFLWEGDPGKLELLHVLWGQE